MIFLAPLVGALIGMLLGGLGGGGSILAVPALVYLLGQSPHTATSGALIVVGLSAVVGTIAHLRHGRVRVGAGITFGVLGTAGAYAGTVASAAVDPNVLLVAFSGLMLVAGLAMMRGGTARDGDGDPATAATATRGYGDVPEEHPDGGTTTPIVPDAPTVAVAVAPAAGTGGRVGLLERARTVRGTAVRSAQRIELNPRSVTKVVLTATVVGLFTGFFGVGGGFIVVPALVLALGFEMPTAVATSLLVIAINSATSLVARLGTTGPLDWPLLGMFAAAAMAGSVAGNRVATRFRPRTLAITFGVLCMVLAGYIATRSVPHLLHA